MKPLPKWVGWVGGVAAIVAAAWEAYSRTPTLEATLIAAAGAIAALFSHSATGSGGK